MQMLNYQEGLPPYFHPTIFCLHEVLLIEENNFSDASFPMKQIEEETNLVNTFHWSIRKQDINTASLFPRGIIVKRMGLAWYLIPLVYSIAKDTGSAASSLNSIST